MLERGIAHPADAELSAEVESLARRDRLDSERALAPLKPAPDAVHLDTTGLSFDEQVDAVIRLVTPLLNSG